MTNDDEWAKQQVSSSLTTHHKEEGIKNKKILSCECQCHNAKRRAYDVIVQFAFISIKICAMVLTLRWYLKY